MCPILTRTFIVICCFTLTSCEGFKVLRLYNKSGSEMIVETRLKIPEYGPAYDLDTAALLLSKTCMLPADSSLELLVSFGSQVFQSKIREKDLPITYLKIITTRDTIIAASQKEIIALIKNDRTKSVKKTDRQFTLDNNQNLESIVIRN